MRKTEPQPPKETDADAAVTFLIKCSKDGEAIA